MKAQIVQGARLSSVDLLRLFKSYRWLPILVLLALGAMRSTTQVADYGIVTETLPNIWDAFFGFYGEWSSFFVQTIVLLLFLLLIGDLVIKDKNSGYYYLLTIRMSKTTYWLSKIATVIICGFLYVFIILLVTLLFGLLGGFELSNEWSSLALYNRVADYDAMEAYNIIMPPINPFDGSISSPLRHVGTLFFQVSTSYSAFSLIGIVLTSKLRTPVAPAAFVLVVVQAISELGSFVSSLKYAEWFNYLLYSLSDSVFRPYAGLDEDLLSMGVGITPYSQELVILVNVALIALMVLGVLVFSRFKTHTSMQANTIQS